MEGTRLNFLPFFCQPIEADSEHARRKITANVSALLAARESQMVAASRVNDVIILCGGLGTRLGQVGTQIQKCLLPWQGCPVLIHVLSKVDEVLPGSRVTLGIGHFATQVRRLVGRRFATLDIRYCEAPVGIGNRARLSHATRNVSTGFLCLAGDVLVSERLMYRLISRYSQSVNDNSMGCIAFSSDHAAAPTHPLATILDGRVVEYHFPPMSQPNESHVREMGVAVYTARFVQELANHSSLELGDVVAQLIARGAHFEGIVSRTPWLHFAELADFFMPEYRHFLDGLSGRTLTGAAQ